MPKWTILSKWGISISELIEGGLKKERYNKRPIVRSEKV